MMKVLFLVLAVTLTLTLILSQLFLLLNIFYQASRINVYTAIVVKSVLYFRLVQLAKTFQSAITVIQIAWIKRGWKTADKKPVKNVDLWQRLQAAMQPHKIEIIWVRGHNGHPENERADQLAVAAIVRK